jgi:hypothetical protein
MNEQTLLVLVLLHFSPNFRLEYRIRDFVFTTFDVDVEANVNFATTYNKHMDKK